MNQLHNYVSVFVYFVLFAAVLTVEKLFFAETEPGLLIIISSFFALGDHILYAAFFTLLLFLLKKMKFPVFLLISLSFFAGLLLELDHIFYKIFYQHLTFSALESGTTLTELWGSFVAELQFPDYFNLLLWSVLQVPIYQSLSDSKHSILLQWIKANTARPYHNLALLVLIFIFTYFFASGNLHHNPLTRFAFSAFSNQTTQIYSPAANEPGNRSLEQIYQPIHGVFENKTVSVIQTPATDQPKHVVFIILESIGSLQFFPEGKISASLTPFLHDIRKHTTLYSRIYTYYPATTRAHVPIQTGGVSFTYETTKQLLYPYQGETLTSQFKQAGYQTALFSAQNLRFGNLDQLYKNMKFDHYFTPETESDKFFKKNKSSSWGVFETAVLPKTFRWIDKQQQKPFFVQFLTSSSHHPYAYPGSKSERKTLVRLERYKKSLRYTDEVLKKVWQELKKRNLLDKTVIYITGDHGQAFGKRHKKNFTHRNYLYEENIRSFFLRIDPQQQQQQIIERAGSFADIAPTIVAEVLQSKMPGAVGQVLSQADYQNRIQFFHKHQMPAQWGLIDGKWKYISQQGSSDEAELYDLENDPTEQHNLASHYPGRIKQYQQRVAQWSVTMQKKYAENIQAEKSLTLSPQELASKGPKKLRIGLRVNRNLFESQQVFHPDEDIVAQVYRIPDNLRHDYYFIWTSPSGKSVKKRVKVKPAWERVYNELDYPRAMEEGQWQLKVETDVGKTFGLSFKVDKSATLKDPRDRALGPREISTGYLDNNRKFVPSEKFHPMETIAIRGSGLAYKEKKKLQLILVSPEKRRYVQAFTMKKGQKEYKLLFDKHWPLVDGKWEVNIRLDKELLVQTHIQIDTQAKLNNRSVIDSRTRGEKFANKHVIARSADHSVHKVLIIDDNINPAHMQLYGYMRQNMPLLMQRKLQKPHSIAILEALYTVKNPDQVDKFPFLLQRPSRNNWYSKNLVSLLDIMNILQIPNKWLDIKHSLHGRFESLYQQLSQSYEVLSAQEHLYTAVKPHLAQMLGQLTGSFTLLHVPRIDCSETKIFQGNLVQGIFGRNAHDTKISQQVNCHDEHVLAMDKHLNQIIDQLQQSGKPAILFYGSRRSPHFFEKNGHLNENLDNKYRHVPMLVWISKQYQQQYPERVRQLFAHQDRPKPVDTFFHTLLGLGGIKTTLYNPEHDFSSLLFKEQKITDNKKNRNDETFSKLTQQANIRKIIASSQDKRILPHRTNSIGKLHKILHDGYRSFELDIVFNSKQQQFEVGHDSRAMSQLHLPLFLENTPDTVDKIWFDTKNINKQNIDDLLQRLLQLDEKFNLKQRIIVEGQLTDSIFHKIADAGFYTSFYLPTQRIIRLLKQDKNKAMQQLAHKIASQIALQKVRAVSFDSKLYPFVKRYLEPLIDKKIDYLTWDMSVPLRSPDFFRLLNSKAYYWDERITTILVAYYTEFTF